MIVCGLLKCCICWNNKTKSRLHLDRAEDQHLSAPSPNWVSYKSCKGDEAILNPLQNSFKLVAPLRNFVAFLFGHEKKMWKRKFFFAQHTKSKPFLPEDSIIQNYNTSLIVGNCSCSEFYGVRPPSIPTQSLCVDKPVSKSIAVRASGLLRTGRGRPAPPLLFLCKHVCFTNSGQSENCRYVSGWYVQLFKNISMATNK